MWISKSFKTKKQPEAEAGVVTLSSGKTTEAAASFASRNMKSWAPYGYSFCAPVGAEVLMLNTSAGMCCAGTKMAETALDSGEISLTSLGNAKILLKNDGSVQINGITITNSGEIHSESGGVLYGGID